MSAVKKEKWLLKEIETWQQNQIVSEDTAEILKNMYKPKKGISFLMVLFSVIGSLLIGMGIVLVSANNWWYSLPIALKAVIGFLPLVLSELLVLYVYRHKINSVAFKESAAILNMAGVFASFALVDQIFHLPTDFTNYILVCALLSLPTMLIMDAISPLIIYYWAAINGGVCFSEDAGMIIAVLLFSIGAVFALRKCLDKNGKSTYLSLITLSSAITLVFLAAATYEADLTIVLYVFAFLLFASAPLLEGIWGVFETVGRIYFLILTFVLTYSGLWDYRAEFESDVFLIVTIAVAVLALLLTVKNIMDKKYCPFSIAVFAALVCRGIWGIFSLTGALHEFFFTLLFNLILLALSIWCIFDGARKVNLYDANTGMVTLCTLIILRFFDSDLSLVGRGIVFLILGSGFLLFNLYLVKTKKRIKEETV